MNVKLVVVQGRDRGKALLFPFGEFLIGRGTECHLRPNSDWVSRQHCLLRVTPDGVFIRDLGSRNGTLVNGQRVIEERPLAGGDEIQVGPLVFQLQLELFSPQPAPAAPVVPEQEETNAQCVDTAELPSLKEDQSTDALE
ncbi:MAG TPA: FHA domain-containing protein [Gemmataceae bacterium]|nr:FHA domain-containing protein [Gemmataceae bacterium]